jgi:peptidyl-tRNA hydrolase, PTH1 family
MRGIPRWEKSRFENVELELPWQNRGASIAPGHPGNRLRGASLVKIVIGLGNPGREYAATRHNLGFMVVDELARRLAASERRNRFQSILVEAFDDGQKIALVKPQTYMNLSGSSVREVVRWYKVPLDDLLVVVDDIDLPFTAMRLRARGGSGGHNGLKSIIAELGTDEFSRLRIGVGRGQGEAIRQVLTRFGPEEGRLLPNTIRAAADCVLEWERAGIISAMNRCNRTPDSQAPTMPEDRGA